MADGNDPELIFALVGATGTDLADTSKCLKQALEAQDYTVVPIRLSDLIARFAQDDEPEAKFEDDHIEQAMARGTAIREKIGHGDGVVRLGIKEIAAERKRLSGAVEKPHPRTAYILRSLKHPEEVNTLRKVYKDSVQIIAVYESKSVRAKRLFEKIRKSRRPKLARPAPEDNNKWKLRADEIIQRDEDERGRTLGQHLQNTFYLADFFAARGVKSKPLSQQIDRYIALLFGARFITPTLDEVASFQAQAAAYRSADLSRQVGAVITLADGAVIASGYNEVPAAGGGHYVEEYQSPECDHRDYTSEMDASAASKHELIAEIFRALLRAKWLDEEFRVISAHDLTNRALNAPVEDRDGSTAILADAQVTNLLEFGRCVHAEMSALMEAARKGRPVEGATLYCTTFPCHICARHIVAAGVSRVVYIEPYQKSQAKALYPDSISVDGSEGTDPKSVRFEPFVGVAPRRYRRMFQMLRRKDKATGYAVPPDFREREPRDYAAFSVYRESESWYINTASVLIRNPGVENGQQN